MASQTDESLTGIAKLEVEVDFKDGSKHKYKYRQSGLNVDVEMEKNNLKRNDPESAHEVERLVRKLHLTENTNEDVLLRRTMEALNLNEHDIAEIDIDVKFSSGEEMEAEQRFVPQ